MEMRREKGGGVGREERSGKREREKKREREREKVTREIA